MIPVKFQHVLHRKIKRKDFCKMEYFHTKKSFFQLRATNGKIFKAQSIPTPFSLPLSLYPPFLLPFPLLSYPLLLSALKSSAEFISFLRKHFWLCGNSSITHFVHKDDKLQDWGLGIFSRFYFEREDKHFISTFLKG